MLKTDVDGSQGLIEGGFKETDEELILRKSLIKDRLLNKPIKKDNIERKEFFLKLYLKKLKGYLFRKKAKVNKPNLLQKINSLILNWWRKEQTESMIDLIIFVALHGIIGAPAILSLLMIANSSIGVIQIIRGNVILSLIVLLAGFGGFYYLLIDINKEMLATWGTKQKTNKK